jgi:hypothetical protein
MVIPRVHVLYDIRLSVQRLDLMTSTCRLGFESGFSRPWFELLIQVHTTGHASSFKEGLVLLNPFAYSGLPLEYLHAQRRCFLLRQVGPLLLDSFVRNVNLLVNQPLGPCSPFLQALFSGYRLVGDFPPQYLACNISKLEKVWTLAAYSAWRYKPLTSVYVSS